MKKKLLLLYLLFLVALSDANAISLVAHRHYVILVSTEATALNVYSAQELKKYLEKSFQDTSFEIIRGASLKPNMLVLCPDNYTSKAKTLRWDIHDKALQKDGYLIKSQPQSLSFCGGNGRGLLYGIYSFLEDRVGCRWYSADTQIVPTYRSLNITPGETRYNPPVKWRSILYYELSDTYLAGILKLNGNAYTQREREPHRFSVGERAADWGYWCHSLYQLVPPSLYTTHPEYFSEVQGKRVAPEVEHGGTQLCLSNPALINIAVEHLQSAIQKPQKNIPIWADSLAYYWSVSQMDGNGYCTCPSCRALDNADASHSGSILHFVNQVASHFPDKKIATLAYIYSRKAPLHTRPASNVAIQLCAIETARDGINYPIGTSPVHKSFRDDMTAWGKICKDIVIWDYVIQFQNLVSPFPNLNVMQNNIRFYVKNNATGIFCQGNREKGGEFAELRGYLLSKLLWNPDCDVEALKQDFLKGYYGKAAPYISKYISLMENELAKSHQTLSMDGDPEAHQRGYLSEENIKKYSELFDEAERKVNDDKRSLAHVQKERMPLMYVQLRLKYGTVPERRRILDRFTSLAESNNVWMLSEVDWRKDQSGNREMFMRKMTKDLEAENKR